MKRILSFILALAILLGMMPMTALATEETETNPWSGRSAVFVGDSITAGSGTTKLYYRFLEESLGFGSVTGMGIGGSCISSGSDYGNNNTPLINRYKNIPSADLIQIFMGTNDYGHATPIGSPEDTQAGTFYGALNTIIPYLLETHKESKIVFVTPLHRNAKSTGTTSTSEYDPNASGHTLHDYVEAIKQVCAMHGVSVIDLYTESEMDPRLDPKNTAYFPDGLHPNAAGHELIAGIMESHIREYEPVKIEPIVQTELIQGNKFSASNDQPCRASSRINYYLKAGTVITLKNPDVMQWACAKTNGEISSTNLGYFPDSQWTDKETAVVAEDGWVGFVFKYRDETKVFDLTKPLSDYITIEEPHTHTYENGICTVCGAEDPSAVTESLSLRYDDHYDVTGKTVEIIDAGTPTSYKVGYGVAEGTLDDAVVTLEGNYLIATGIGAATVRIDGTVYDITVTAAPISLILLIGQSNMRGSEGNANQSIVCPDGMVYATYGDDRGADNTAMTVSNATHFAPSALTGEYSNINTAGTTDCLSGYPVYSLTEAGAGKIGPDSGFAYEWVKQTGDKVWIVNAAHGGTSINVWQPGTTEYEQCQALFTACQETLRKEISAGHFTLSHMGYFWCQGCSDRTQSAAWYVEKYLAMHEGFKTELAFDHDSNPETADKTFEFGGIIPVRVGSTATCYRDGAYTVSNPYAYHESFVDLRMNGPRVAQYWMINNPDLPDIWGVCNIGDDWVWMPDGTNGVTEYFQAHYENGTVDYTTQVTQIASWYTPTTPKAVHDSIHYNQIGYNEVGRESARNALIMLGEIEAPDVETNVELLTWDGYTEATQVPSSTTGNSATLVVPVVYPIWKSKDVTYELSEGLSWNYYDLLADTAETEGVLTAIGAQGSVNVAKGTPGSHFDSHLSQLPENVCCGLNLWSVLEHDEYYYASGTHWGIYSSGEVPSVTILVNPGDHIFATSFGKAGENGHTSSNGIRVTFFSAYGIAKTMTPAECYAEFSANGGYLIAPEGAVAINIAMWNNSDDNEIYILNLPHNESDEICSICGKNSSHVHTWSNWEAVTKPSIYAPGEDKRTCAGCGETETREVNSIWQTADFADHLRQLPENVCCGLNLWGVLEHDKQYFANGIKWDYHTSRDVPSVTFAVNPGDKIYATSFGPAATNGHGSANGIRVTFFGINGVIKTMGTAETYAEFAANGGYLIAPEGTVAINIPMWNNSDENEIYILNRDHCYENGTCTACGEAEPVEAFTSTDELVLALRREMVQRNTLIQLRLNGTALSASEVSALILQAYAHTGVPYEGDYIRANMVGYSWSVTTGSDAEGVYSIVTLECNFISDAQMEAEVDAAVDALLAELDLWDATNYEKVKGVYDWITENVQYDFPWDDLEEDTTYYKHTTHAALIAKNAVCQGYASLYYRLMLELGVDCRYISGISTDITGTENHAWNIVYLDGYYYNVDATWDRDLMGHYRYFLCTEANFTGHTRNAEYNTPQFHAQYPMAIAPYVRNIAASGTINGNIAWVLDGDTGTLTVAGTGAIPSYRFSHAPWYDYRESVRKIVVSEGITEVGERAFYWCTNCTEVILPDSLVAIREYGFNNLRNLKTITLPPNLRVIEFCAFSECVALTSITLPNSVTTVGSNAFSNCYALTSAVLSSGMTTVPSSMFGGDYMLKSVVLPEGITYIDDTAFIDCGFTSFTLPSTVTGLGTAVFSNCTSLTQFIVEAGNPTYKAVDGVLFSADGTHLICYPAAKSNYSYSVPEGTRYIDYGAFRGQKYMTFVYFPSTLIEIGGYSFSYCKKLYSVTFVSNIDTIGSDAFRSCTSLYSATFNNPDVYLVGYTFANCTALRNISLPTNLREIPNGLFYGCTYLASITIPSTATKIGSSAFLDCDNLVSITIPGNVKSIGQQAFDFCNKLETIVFEEGVTTLGWICIRNAPKLKKVVIPSSVTRIEQPSNTTSFLFDDCPNVVLHVSCGSYGYSYAVSRGLSYQLSHTVTATVVHPTCTTQGYTRYHCACGSIDYNTDYVSAWGHDYDANIVPPTCHEEGYTCYTCLNCGDTYYDDFVPAAHSYGAWYVIKDATCTENGEKRRDCANCDHFETEVIAAIGHNYNSVVTAPTCTEQGYTTHTCANCGNSYTDNLTAALGHNWDSGVVTVEPTEETEGERLYTCQRCGTTRTEVIPTIDHVHSYNAVVTAPTCTEQGYTTHTCRCGDSYVDSYTPATGHSYGAWYVIKDATCTEDGQKRRDCANCAHFETEVIAAIGHNYTSKVTAPTCTEQGYTTHTCANCGDSYVDSYVNAKGHSYGAWYTVKEATCTENGQKRRDCANCDHFETEVIAAIGHNYTSKVTAPTCTEQGYTTHTCANCGDSYIDSYVNAKGHSYGAWYTVKDATCTEDGQKRRDCQNCDHFETEVIAAIGHNYNSVVTAPTCTEQGYTTHTCANCGDSYVDSYVNAKGHSYGAWYVIKDATCTEDGQKRRDCANCDHFETEVIAAIGHNYNSVVTAPTCTEQGYTTHTCANCGDSYIDSYVNAKGHSYGAWYVVKEATCTEDGQKRHDCANCDHFETEVISATGHNYTSKVTAPTCTEQGYTTHTCANCGDSYIDSYVNATGHSYGAWYTVKEATCTEDGQKRRDCANCDHFETEVIAAIGHNYVSVVTAPACTEKGYTTHTCANCGDSYIDSYTPATGHSYGAWYTVKDATCTEDGQKRRDCANCDHCETEVIAAIGHNYVSVVTAPTCTEQGYTTHTCANCGDSYIDSYVNATGHSYDAWYVIKDATCTEDGEKRRDCANCDHFETEVIAAIGHNYTSKVTAPTCTEQGYTTHTCANCGDSYIDSYVNAKGHSYGAWYTVKDATCTEDGQKRRDCANCDHFETEVIVAIGHNYTSKVTAPTCTEQGYTTHTCRCGDSYVDSYVDALGHNHVVTDSRNATCTEDGYITYTCHCGDSYTEVLEATGHSYVDGACEHCGEADPDATLLGDANGDGTINYLDAMLIAQYYVGDIGAEDLVLSAADVNGDGTVNYLDAMLVAQYYVGDIDSFPAEG